MCRDPPGETSARENATDRTLKAVVGAHKASRAEGVCVRAEALCTGILRHASQDRLRRVSGRPLRIPAYRVPRRLQPVSGQLQVSQDAPAVSQDGVSQDATAVSQDIRACPRIPNACPKIRYPRTRPACPGTRSGVLGYAKIACYLICPGIPPPCLRTRRVLGYAFRVPGLNKPAETLFEYS